MTIKVLCNCGTKFAFDVEPVDGRMPVEIACPGCGADATGKANEEIRAQLPPSSAPAPAPKIHIRLPAAPAASPAHPAAGPGATPHGGPSPTPIHVSVGPKPASTEAPPVRVAPVMPTPGAATRLSVAGHAAPPSPPPPQATVAVAAPPPPSPVASTPPPPPPPPPNSQASPTVRCPKHPTQDATDTCFVCGKPICPECMAQFGYLCSPYCQEQARRKELPVPTYAGQKTVLWQKEVRTGNRLVTALAVAAGLVVLLAGVYKFWLSRPKVAFTLATPKAVPFLHAQFLDADRILAVTSQRVSVREWKTDKELWSLALSAATNGRGTAPSSALDDGPFLGSGDGADVAVRVVGGDVWVANHERVWRLDLASGKSKAEIPLPVPVRQVAADDQGILAVGWTNEFVRNVTRVDFKTGQASADVLRLPVIRRRPPPAAVEIDADAPLPPPDLLAEVLPAGAGALGLSARLLEARIIQRDAVKQTGKSILDREGGPTASQSLDAAMEMMNQNQAPVTEDQSLYQVSLRRLFAAGPEWTGVVTGKPAIFPLRTVDLLIAGTTLVAFDKGNRKVWEARLNYGVGPRFFSSLAEPEPLDQPGVQPAVESGARIYVFDQGTLTAFDSRDGRVAWRLPSVGIGTVVPAGGSLYVASTTAGPESIQYSQDLTLNEKIAKVLLKVDAATGRVIWTQERLGDEPRASGKFLYAAVRKRFLMDGVGEGDSRLHYYLRRLDTGSGKEIWEYYQRGSAEGYEARENLLLLRFPEELKVLKFFSL